MKIQFAEGWSEYKDGGYYRKNDGEPFDVDARFGQELIATGIFVEAEAKAEGPKKKSSGKGDKS